MSCPPQTVIVIIPTLNPDHHLLSVVNALKERGFNEFVVVNDGSGTESQHWLSMIATYPEVVLLKHSVNLGKGRALKTAFNHCLDLLDQREDIVGVITVDGDGQHEADDVAACAEGLLSHKGFLTLGVRDFRKKGIPLRSRVGNIVTNCIFKICCGMDIGDTQTGLRAIPVSFLPFYMSVVGERFEYETNMLLETKKRGLPFNLVSVNTVYAEGNKSSHFNPVLDSLRIYTLIVMFFLISLISAFLDLALFAFFLRIFSELHFGSKVFFATVLARILSSLFNYLFNKKTVFQNQSGYRSTLAKYSMLCAAQTVISYGGVLFFGQVFTVHLHIVIVKAIWDLLLSVVSFQLQREWVFGGRNAV